MKASRLKERKAGQKGNFSKTLKYYFIPHDDNNHQPFIIRHPALIFYTLVLILTKLIVTVFLFASYPSFGQFASVTTGSIVNLTNQTRQKNNLPALKTSRNLNQAAFQKAQDMIANNYFSHDSPSGVKFWKWIVNAGYKYLTAGENLAKDFTSASSVHNALMASASHRKNILNTKFTEIGVSIVSGKINNKNTIVLVEMFGQPKTTAKTAEVTTAQPSNNAASSKTNSSVTSLPSPFYQAEIQGFKTDTLTLKSTEEITYWVDFKNTGNTTWFNTGENFIALNATDPAGRISLFKHSSWLSDYRPIKLAKDKVLPQETARFEFTLKAPKEAGQYSESFQLVAENLTWIEGSHFTIPITVAVPIIANVNTPPVATTNQNLNVNQNLSGVTTNNNTNATEEVVSEVSDEPTNLMVSNTEVTIEPKGMTKFIMTYSQIIFWFFLFFISLALLINVFVKIRVQHFSIIIPTLLVIILAVMMLITRIHFMEKIISQPITLL